MWALAPWALINRLWCSIITTGTRCIWPYCYSCCCYSLLVFGFVYTLVLHVSRVAAKLHLETNTFPFSHTPVCGRFAEAPSFTNRAFQAHGKASFMAVCVMPGITVSSEGCSRVGSNLAGRFGSAHALVF